MNDIVSIIVPTYNRANVIEKCLLSITTQTYKNIEIIVIDDGSTDNTKKTIDNLTKNDSRIKYFYQNNQGVSNARNYGLEIARGKYVCFVDSDDTISSGMIELMIKEYESKEVDIVFCNYQSNKSGLVLCNQKIENKSELKEDILYELIQKHIVPNIGTKIYKMDIIKENKIKFINYSFYEDYCFCLDYLYYAKEIAIIDKPFYTYNYTEKSLSNVYKDNLDKSSEIFLSKLQRVLNKDELLNNLKIKIFITLIKNETKKGYKNYKKTIKEACKHYKINIQKVYISNKLKMFLYLIKTKNYRISYMIIKNFIR